MKPIQSNEAKTLTVVRIQRTCVHDGPGIRTTVFFRGCGLRCQWCQNPETIEFRVPQAEDRQLSPDALLEVLLRDERYYRSSGGGVTLSGGEPLLQDSECLLQLLKGLQERNISVSVETSLHVPYKNIERVMPYVNLFLVDFKVIGNNALHKELTGQEDGIIRANFENLIRQGANVRVRTVMVPDRTDGEKDIKTAAEFLKGLGVERIELLKYHNMYEDKAKRLGLSIPQLGIGGDSALLALRNGARLFRQYGLEPYSDEFSEKPKKAVFTKRVLDIQTSIRTSLREISFEASRLKTEYYKRNKGFKKPVHIHRAERLRYVLEQKKKIVYENELLVGNFTEKRVAGQVWEEQYGILYISFLYKAHKQTPVNFHSTKKERRHFYWRIFPYWLKNSLVTRAHDRSPREFIKTLSRVAEMSAGFNNNFAAIAHYIVNFDRLLELGTTGLKREAERAAAEHPENNQDFYRGVIIALDGLERFGEQYAALLTKMSEEEENPARKRELSEMAAICVQVPKYPARTFKEALQSMTFLQIALCLEAYENAVSYGRVDQLLYPYYKKDLEEGRITYEEAKELLCLFILKMDEVILVNDGDGFLNIGKNFETLSTDQALTFGGVDSKGEDATNDLTYMLIDACELQPLAVNMCARIHAGSPKKYIDRLAEIYINGCPMPELFSDNIYIESLQKHYKTSLENARDYAIVGCVEPIASKDHFGNTDCANMNLALPLLQAMKGHQHDLWNFDRKMQLEKLVTKTVEYMNRKGTVKNQKRLAKRTERIRKRDVKRGLYTYDPPKNMEELLARFQTRLNALAGGILSDQQKIERTLSKYFTTPLASSLYRGCLLRGKDVYEGGTDYNTAGIQAVGVTDVADSLYAIEELVFRTKKYTMLDMIEGTNLDFNGERFQTLRADILALPKFGEDGHSEPARWVTKVMEIYNNALKVCPYAVRNGSYEAGYYALNVSDRYGLKTQALPSGRRKGVPLANSITPHYGMEQGDLLSALNAISEVNFVDYAVNGATVTFTVDSALFPGESGVDNLSAIFKTFLTTGGMQFQPNIISKDILIEAYHHPEKHPYLMVRVAGYCAYFQELSDELKRIILNRTCYS